MIVRRTTPISWYVPKLIVNKLGVSFQIHWCWKNEDGEKQHWPIKWWTIFFKPLRFRTHNAR